MKIGIMTFHWATNYGAVLQAYCLQEHLREQGHDVEIINYKLRRYDTSFWNFFKHPSNWRKFKKYRILKEKERLIENFRNRNLRLSRRYYSSSELMKADFDYDVLISGSDQVLNKSYTMEAEGKPSHAYFLGFGNDNTKRIGYAVSFGCTEYTKIVIDTTKDWVNRFDFVGVRENTGLYILKQLVYNKTKAVVPDPTILYGSRLFVKLGVSIPKEKDDYTCVYMLRKEITIEGNVRYIDETKTPITMQQWLVMIWRAGFMIRSSYDGTGGGIVWGVGFAVVVEDGKGRGMNDRFYTLLEKISLTRQIIENEEDVAKLKSISIDWEKVDALLAGFREVGRSFLQNSMS